MLKNKFFKYKLIRHKLVQHTPSTLYLCALWISLSVLNALSTPVVHASSRCADLISSSFDSSTKNTLGSSSKNALGASLVNTFDFYANSPPPKEGTKNFQSYIGELLEKQIIGEPQLIQFIENLEKGELINPISEGEARVSTPLLIQRKGLQKYLDKSSLNQKELLIWSRAALEKRARVRVSREEAREETQEIYQEFEFHPVKRPVRFAVRHGGKKGKIYKKHVTLTYPIEVQSTPVTQRQWVEVMGENPSRFVGGEDSVVWAFDGKAIELQPDNPIESVTWWSALVFANRLSAKHGFHPAYDFIDVMWKPGTRPEDGTLRPSHQEHGYNIKIYAKGKSYRHYEGDIYYQAEGYRLPTAAEQEYMLLGGRKAKGGFFKSKAEMGAYAWYKGNSGNRTHPVGLLNPIMIDGKAFYELYGNVQEFGWGENVVGLKGYSIRNPVQESYGSEMGNSAGGSFLSDWNGFLWSFHKNHEKVHKGSGVGFRLVRTIKQGDGE